MIAGCIDRMRTSGCAGCERRDACADLFGDGRFDLESLFRRRATTPRPAAGSAERTPLHALLLMAASAIGRWAEQETHPHRDQGAQRGPPATPAADDGAKSAAVPPAATPGAFCAEVERRLEPLLVEGTVRIDQVARAMGCSRQTLYRRLKAEGTTYERLLDGLRRRLAVRLLMDGMAVKDVAYRLGFSDPAAFSRAFKRWTGTCPSDARG